MLADPRYWQSHYHGGAEQERWLRHFGYSDRIRYYWPAPAARRAVERLLGHLGDRSIPSSLIGEFFPDLHARVVSGASSRSRGTCWSRPFATCFGSTQQPAPLPVTDRHLS